MPSKWRGCTLMLMAIFFSSANCSRVFPNSPLAAWMLDNLSPPLPPNFLTPSLGFIIACLFFSTSSSLFLLASYSLALRSASSRIFLSSSDFFCSVSLVSSWLPVRWPCARLPRASSSPPRISSVPSVWSPLLPLHLHILLLRGLLKSRNLLLLILLLVLLFIFLFLIFLLI